MCAQLDRFQPIINNAYNQYIHEIYKYPSMNTYCYITSVTRGHTRYKSPLMPDIGLYSP